MDAKIDEGKQRESIARKAAISKMTPALKAEIENEVASDAAIDQFWENYIPEFIDIVSKYYQECLVSTAEHAIGARRYVFSKGAEDFVQAELLVYVEGKKKPVPLKTPDNFLAFLKNGVLQRVQDELKKETPNPEPDHQIETLINKEESFRLASIEADICIEAVHTFFEILKGRKNTAASKAKYLRIISCLNLLRQGVVPWGNIFKTKAVIGDIDTNDPVNKIVYEHLQLVPQPMSKSSLAKTLGIDVDTVSKDLTQIKEAITEAAEKHGLNAKVVRNCVLGENPNSRS